MSTARLSGVENPCSDFSLTPTKLAKTAQTMHSTQSIIYNIEHACMLAFHVYIIFLQMVLTGALPSQWFHASSGLEPRGAPGCYPLEALCASTLTIQPRRQLGNRSNKHGMDIHVQKVIRHNRNVTLMPFPWGDYHSAYFSACCID